MGHEPVLVGIAGLGRSGWNIHARLLAQLKDRYRVAAALDTLPARRAEAEARFGCRTYSAYDELLGDERVELVVVALPSHLHADAAVSALQLGKHVVCEKPMATTTDDADRMIAAAERSGAILSVFQNRRYSPDFVAVRQVLASGILGRIILIHMTASGFGRRWDWQTRREFGGGSLNNTAVHSLDQALQLMGEGTPEVHCELDRTLTLGDAEDHVKLIMRMPGAPTVDLEVSSACAYGRDAWHVMGTQGGLVGSSSHLHWKWTDVSTLPERKVDTRPTPDRTYNREEYQWVESEWRRDDYTGPGELGYYLDLHAAIRTGAPVNVTAESVRRVVWVLEECHRQAGL
jgi:predicted dehydrogenase